MQFNNLKIYSLSISFIPISIIFSIFLADLLVSLTSIFFLIFIIINKKFDFLNCIEFKLFLFFYTILIISSIFSDYNNSIITSLTYLRFGLFYLLIKYLLINTDNFKQYISSSLVISILILFLGFTLQLLNFDFLVNNKPEFRYSSFFNDEAVLGSYLIKIIPLTIGLLIYFKQHKFLICIFLLSIIMILFSGERSSQLLLILFITISLFYLPYNKKIKVISIFLILTVISTTIFINEKIRHRVLTQTFFQMGILDKEKKYIEIEIKNKNEEKVIMALIKEDHFIPLKYYLMFNASFNIFLDNVLLGSGVKTFRKKCMEPDYYQIQNYSLFKDKPYNFYEGYTGIDSCSTHPHNYYIQILTETGIIAFLIILFLFIYSTYKIFVSRKLHNKFFAIGTFLNLFPIVFTGSFYNNFISILIFLTLSFLLNEQNEKM